MDYLNRNSKVLILLFFAIIIGRKTYSQECVIMATEFSPIYLKDLGKIEDIYSKMKLGDTSRIHLLYISLLSQVNKKEGFYLGIDLNQKIEMTAVTFDSVVFSKCISNNGKYNLDFLFGDTTGSGFYVSNCNNVVSSHRRSILMIFDTARKRWIEYTSLDGHMKESLTDDTKYKYFKGCYELIETVFKDFKVNYTR
jgi:hypothetical protein